MQALSRYRAGLSALLSFLFIDIYKRFLNVSLTFITSMLCDNCQVVSERTAWDGGYVGVNSFGFGGSNVHVLLRSPDSVASSRTAHVAATTTRLATCAGRTKEGVETTLTEMLQHPTDVDMQYLLQTSVGDLPPSTHPYRGVVLVNSTDSRQTVEVQTS